MRLTMLLACMITMLSAHADPYSETRYCGVPKRDSSGKILRSASVIAAFKRAHPCPVTGLPTGACVGWSVDHILPLAVCGCDEVSNMQWLPNTIKSCAGTQCKDRWERVVYSCPK